MGTIQISGSTTPRYVDTTALKNFWVSQEGLTLIQIIVYIVIAFLQMHDSHVSAQQSEAFTKSVVKEIEEFWLAHRELPQSTPTADAQGD